MHREAHWQRSAVMNWFSWDLVHPLINNKLETSIHWWWMFLFLRLTLCMACHLCHIYHQHNQNWETAMCITLGSTLTFLHQHLLMINKTPMIIQLQTLSLNNALFREIPYVYPLILHFNFICCHKWIHTEEMIWTCLMKSFDVSRHMPSIITWITQRCRYCQESNSYSCS